MFYICNNKDKEKELYLAPKERVLMKNYKNIIALSIITICSTLESSQQSNYNIFCCSNVTNVIVPTNYTVNVKQIQVKECPEPKTVKFKASHAGNMKKSHANAKIKALRLRTVIDNEDLMEQKKYKDLEDITQERIANLDIKYTNQYLCYNPYALLSNYSIYSNSSEFLPPRIKKQYLEEKNKKQVAARIQALRLQAAIENPELMDKNKFSRLEQFTQIKADEAKIALNAQCHKKAYNLNYGIYSQDSSRPYQHNKLTRSKNIK